MTPHTEYSLTDLGLTLRPMMAASHRDLETVLRGFNAAYNGRRQRVLKGLSPTMVLCQRLDADPALANPTYKPPDPRVLRKALRIVADAKEVSHPDSPPPARDRVGRAP